MDLRQTVITRADAVGAEPFDSIAWAFEVHVKTPDTGEYNFGCIVGNEDAPDRIAFWRAAEPAFDAEPDYIWES